VKEIAERTHLPQPYLEQILLSVKGAGLVRSKRGVGGGYVLARPPDEITLADIVAAVEGPQILMADHPDHCEGHCILQEVWVGVDNESRRILERVTLAELVERTLSAMRASTLLVRAHGDNGPVGTDLVAPIGATSADQLTAFMGRTVWRASGQPTQMPYPRDAEPPNWGVKAPPSGPQEFPHLKAPPGILRSHALATVVGDWPWTDAFLLIARPGVFVLIRVVVFLLSRERRLNRGARGARPLSPHDRDVWKCRWLGSWCAVQD